MIGYCKEGDVGMPGQRDNQKTNKSQSSVWHLDSLLHVSMPKCQCQDVGAKVSVPKCLVPKCQMSRYPCQNVSMLRAAWNHILRLRTNGLAARSPQGFLPIDMILLAYPNGRIYSAKCEEARRRTSPYRRVYDRWPPLSSAIAAKPEGRGGEMGGASLQGSARGFE